LTVSAAAWASGAGYQKSGRMAKRTHRGQIKGITDRLAALVDQLAN
jgi:hypothetical protein